MRHPAGSPTAYEAHITGLQLESRCKSCHESSFLLLERDSDRVRTDARGKSIIDDDEHEIRIHLLSLGNSLYEKIARTCNEPVAVIVEIGDSGKVIGGRGSRWPEIGALEAKLLSGDLHSLIRSLVE